MFSTMWLNNSLIYCKWTQLDKPLHKKELDKRLTNTQFSVPNVIDPNLEQGFSGTLLDWY